MSGASLSYGLNISKKKQPSKPQPPKRQGLLFDSDSSDEEAKSTDQNIQELSEFGGLSSTKKSTLPSHPPSKSKPNGGSKKGPPLSMYSDLSSALTSKKHASTASALDANIYDYDAVYDSLKPQKKITQQDAERKPKYMSNLLAAAAVRKRDATIAEEKKLAKDREAEGDEFKDKESFVTGAYKKLQADNRRLEAEERVREEEERKGNKGRGMTGFYKGLLEKGEREHAEIVKAVEERGKNGAGEVEGEKERSEADVAREIGERSGGKIAVNDEGQVVDKRQLLRGGLNIVPKPKSTPLANTSRGATSFERSRGSGFVGAGGGKQAMRERQSRMMETQLEQATKRALEEDEEEKAKIERASKSRKTEGDIMSAKERYLARKKEAEEAKKRGEAP